MFALFKFDLHSHSSPPISGNGPLNCQSGPSPVHPTNGQGDLLTSISPPPPPVPQRDKSTSGSHGGGVGGAGGVGGCVGGGGRNGVQGGGNGGEKCKDSHSLPGNYRSKSEGLYHSDNQPLLYMTASQPALQIQVSSS